ncbi:DUF7472 family protein [Natrarchaeobaculum aegyptiacum]|uniref:Uncharacterized protein n=1 Tax=Natrarchaeobaculum aegyptiacum TaxID=745377 RepID=A0A2Z2HVQ0_9EURY|nr:hypothetical protein [Natrarchaeobaculum aegyptiacum]ARS89607.1 hypothetical protein B1756_07560 [Natrarchaeobaculum aegyptiacum]
MLERERIIEIVVAVAAVFVMIGAMLWIGTTYGGDNGVLTTDGAEVLVGAMVGFIVLLLGVGLVLAYVMNEPEGFDDDADAQSF